MSKLDVFFVDNYKDLDIDFHRKIVDDFSYQYFDSDEFLNDLDIHKYYVDPSEEDEKFVVCIIKWHYKLSVYLVLQNDLFITELNELPNFFNKLKLDLLTSPLENSETVPLITIDEFYDHMVAFDDIDQRYIIDKIRDVNIKTKNDLLVSIQSHDKEKFYQIIDSINSDITNVLKLAYLLHLTDTALSTLSKTVNEKNFDTFKDFSIIRLLEEKCDIFKNQLKSPNLTDTKKINLIDGVIQLSLGILKLCFDNILSVLPPIMQDIIIAKIPPKSYDLYKEIIISDNAKQMFDYSSNTFVPEFIKFDISNKSLEQQTDSIAQPLLTTESDEDMVLYPDSPYGFIPEDYFSQKIDKANPEDHYDLKDDIQNEGEEKFAEFINYVAKCQYIENYNKTKALFAYRLTGRLRPADEDLKPIIWCGADNKPEELLYTIRYITTSNRPGMYSKLMKAFFEGPDWPSKGCSSKADDAKTEFRQTLNSIFGDVCGMKYNTKRKKRH